MTRLLCVQSRVFFSTLFSFYTGFHLCYGGLCGGGGGGGGGGGCGAGGAGGGGGHLHAIVEGTTRPSMG